MKAAIKFQFITLSLYFTLMSGCGSHIKVKCPSDGRTVLVLKDLSKVYPVYAKEYDIAAKKIQKAIEDTLKSNTISAGYSDKVIKFREDLKQEAINLENQLKAALLNRQTDPCDKDAGKRFDELLKVISSKNAKLEGMSLKSLSIHVSGDLNIQLDRTKYRPLLPNVRSKVAAALATVHKKYEDNCPIVSISVEAGNRNRDKVVWDVIDLLKSASFKPIPYRRSQSAWRGVPPPMTIKLNPNDILFLKDFAKAISPFLVPPLPVKRDTTNLAGTVEIIFRGEPKFNSDGSVRFE